MHLILKMSLSQMYIQGVKDVVQSEQKNKPMDGDAVDVYSHGPALFV